MRSPTTIIHASVVAIGTAGVLIRGSSGAGKSTLAMALIEDPRQDTVLVADDQVRIETRAGTLIAAPPDALAGLIELRGIGILPRPFLPEARVRLVVDLLPPPDCPRLPTAADRSTTVLGIVLPRVAIAIGSPDGALRVRVALREWLS